MVVRFLFLNELWTRLLYSFLYLFSNRSISLIFALPSVYFTWTTYSSRSFITVIVFKALPYSNTKFHQSGILFCPSLSVICLLGLKNINVALQFPVALPSTSNRYLLHYYHPVKLQKINTNSYIFMKLNFWNSLTTEPYRSETV